MVHYYQKRWVFTWNADDRDDLVDSRELQEFLSKIAEEGVFQKERGQKSGRVHYQGRFVLKGPRTGKKQLLKLFSEINCVTNLTLEFEKVYNSTRYCTKSTTRVDGPWYIGTDYYRTKHSTMSIILKKWQEQLLRRLKSSLGQTYRERKVIWVQDPKGGSGKSTFLRYLSLNQAELRVKKLPLDKPDRLRMMICKIVMKEDVDAFTFDFTRTLDEDTSIKSLFQIIEELKNAHVVSAMYGNPMEVIFTPPYVLIFTNEDISKYCQYLSDDRWVAFEIINDELYDIVDVKGYAPHDYNTRYKKLDEFDKK